MLYFTIRSLSISVREFGSDEPDLILKITPGDNNGHNN